MSPQFTCSRAVMAAPAILLFAATRVAQLIAAVVPQGNYNGNIDNNMASHGMIRATGQHSAAAAAIADDAASSLVVTADSHYGDGTGSVGHHHKKHNHFPDRKKSHDHDDNDQENSNSFDFYVFSMTYQPEFCFEKHEEPEGCHKPKKIWDRLTIHGLWPNNNDGTYPQNCSKEKFDLTSLDTIRTELEDEWLNIKALPGSKSHAGFWEHEWSKHGTCTGLSQLDYFSGALKQLIDTPSIVKEAEMNQSFVKRDELLKFYGGNEFAVLVCERGYLSEVRVCHQKEIDGNVGERMGCPGAILGENSCGSEIKIAKFVVVHTEHGIDKEEDVLVEPAAGVEKKQE